MLVLSRNAEKVIHMRTPAGETIKIKNLGKFRAKFGIEAPPGYQILREELDVDGDLPPEEGAA